MTINIIREINLNSQPNISMQIQEDRSVIPIFKELNKIYSDVDGAIKLKHEPRYHNLKNSFISNFGEEPQFYGRAPGRVNIIGGHVDYNGYTVVNTAIE